MSAKHKFKIYLAGPDVFHEQSYEIGEKKKELCKKYGFEGLYPLDNEIQTSDNLKKMSDDIFTGNITMIEQSDAIIANLHPYRSPSADTGTVFEIGMAFGLGKIIYGYSYINLLYKERVINQFDGYYVKEKNVWKDKHGDIIEDFGLFDNLMIPNAIEESGGEFIVSNSNNINPFLNLEPFEACLESIYRKIIQNYH